MLKIPILLFLPGLRLSTVTTSWTPANRRTCMSGCKLWIFAKGAADKEEPQDQSDLQSASRGKPQHWSDLDSLACHRLFLLETSPASLLSVSSWLVLLLIQHRQFSQGPHCTRSPALACVPSKAIRFNCSVKTSRGGVRLLARSQQDTQFLERRLRVKIQPLLIILQRFCVGQAAQRLWPSSLMANCTNSFFPILTPLLIWSICFQFAETCVPNRCDTRYLQWGWRSCSCGEHLQSVAVTLGDGTAVTLRFELRSDDKCCVFACFWFVELEMGSKFKLADGLCLRGRVKTRCKGFKWQFMVSQVIVPIRRLRGGWPLKIAVKSKLVFGLNWIGVTWSFS